MKFKKFLANKRKEDLHYSLPSETRKEISIDEAVKLLKIECSQATNNIPLYRGTLSSYDYFILDPSKRVRKGTSDTNVTNYLVDYSPKWKDYPKRNKSVIFSSANEVSYYGNSYRVFPFDNAKIAVCNSSDFWGSLNIEIESLNSILRNAGFRGSNVKDWLSFKEQVSRIEKNPKFPEIFNRYFIVDIRQTKNRSEKVKITQTKNDILDRILNGEKFINIMLNYIKRPEEYKMSLKNISGSLEEYRNKDKEMWTDSKCLLINEIIFSKKAKFLPYRNKYEE